MVIKARKEMKNLKVFEVDNFPVRLYSGLIEIKKLVMTGNGNFIASGTLSSCDEEGYITGTALDAGDELIVNDISTVALCADDNLTLEVPRKLWHVRWSYEEGEGLLAVLLDGQLKIKKLAGKSLPVWALPTVLKELGELKYFEILRPRTLVIREGTSGCREFLVYELYDEEFLDQKITSRLHVSCAGKLEENVKIRVRDLDILIPALQEYYHQEGDRDISVKIYSPTLKGEYK